MKPLDSSLQYPRHHLSKPTHVDLDVHCIRVTFVHKLATSAIRTRDAADQSLFGLFEGVGLGYNELI